ncbi:hypothetical protein Tco_1172162 [Tanacetum coccineum]
MRRERSISSRQRSKEGGVFKRLGSKGKSVSAHSDSYRRNSHSKYTEALSESEDSEGGHWKSRSKKNKSYREEDDLSQPWVCKEVDPFTPRIRYFDFPETRMPSHIKTYDGTGGRVYERLCEKIQTGKQGITNPALIKRLHDKIPKTVDEMMRVTTSFLRGEVTASNHEQKKTFPPWKHHEGSQKQNFKKGGFRNQQRSERKQDRFSLLTKTPKEIFALDKGKFKAPPPMTTPVEKQNHAKFCEFHGEVGHNTDECMHLKKQIEEMLKAGKLSHLIKELK